MPTTVHIRESWQASRRKPANAGRTGPGARAAGDGYGAASGSAILKETRP